jgi:hypothetical protein
VSSRPPLGHEVVLERAGTTWLEAEVSGYDGADVLLRIRAETLSISLPPVVDAVPVPATLVWTTDRGLFRAPVAATPERERWRAAFQAQAARIQRRTYARLPMSTPMTLSHERGTSRGTLVDLSEAALRARFGLRDAPRLCPGDTVRAAFTLHHTGFMLRGTVLREQGTGEPHTVDVVVMLDIPARTANDLRRNVVFEQVERQREQAPERWQDAP